MALSYWIWLFLITLSLWSAWRVLGLAEKWRYWRLDTLGKITAISNKINKTANLTEQKQLLARLKDLAEAYRKEQKAAVVPKKSAWEVHEDAYKPFYRLIALQSLSVIFLLFAWWIFFGFELNPIEELRKILGFSKDGKGFAEILIALLGLFPALIVWFYRDLNKYREMETAHRDVIFSEHKQLVEWATTEAKIETTAPAEAEPATQATTANAPMIQVAGIYQLAPFLKDHHANLYQRSTLETLRAIVNAGRPKWVAWVKAYEAYIEAGKTTPEPAKPSLTAAEKAVHAVLRENPMLFYHPNFNAKDFNLAGFDGSGLVLVGCDLSGAMLLGANMSRAQLQGVDLSDAYLQGACMNEARLQGLISPRVSFQGAQLKYASFQGSFGIKSDLRNITISYSKLENEKRFTNTNLQNSIVSEPKLESEGETIEFIKSLILQDALSIADSSVPILFDSKTLKSAHLAAVRALTEQGLTPTTKASLEAERKAQAITESETL